MISVRVNWKVYKTAVITAMMYAAGTWAMKKAQEKKLDVVEMRMVVWMCGVTDVGRMRNERIGRTSNM